MSLPDEQAAQLMSKLNPKQVEAVSIEIAKLGSVTGDEQEVAIREFAGANPSAMAVRAGGLEVAKQLVEKAMGKNAGAMLDSVRQSIEAVPFGFLQKVDNQNLLTFIMDEHPQTIALILSHLHPPQAAEIIKGLPPERQLSVIRRMATMGQTSPEIIKEVERGLEHRMSSVVSQQFENAGGVPSVASMLNVIDRATERSLLENLSREDPELVEEIRRLMFVFDDINSLGNKEIQTLLKNVDSSQWAMAPEGRQSRVEGEDPGEHVEAGGRYAPRGNGVPRAGQALSRRADATADRRRCPPLGGRRRNQYAQRRTGRAVGQLRFGDYCATSACSIAPRITLNALFRDWKSSSATL